MPAMTGTAPTAPRFAALALSLLPGLAAAQSPPAGPSTFLDSIEVRVVNVDVVVLDDEGRPVPGLTREDFELFVDGQPVELSNFAAYEEAGAASAGEAALVTPAGAPPAAAAPAPDSMRVAPPATWIVYVDQSNLQPGPRNQLVREVTDFLGRAVRAGDRTMVATFDGVSLKILSPLAADRQPALDALGKLEKQVGFPSGMRGRANQIQRDISQIVPGSPSAEADAATVENEIEIAGQELALRLRASFTAFSDLLAIVAGVEGRVALLYGGGGFEADPTENLYRLLQSRMGGSFDPGPSPSRRRDPLNTQIQTDYARLLRTVNSSRVTVYSIFAGERGGVVGADVGGDPGASGPSLSLESPESSSTLAAFATETGGRAFVGAPDLAERLETARRDLATYYSLAFHPAEGAPPEFRKIDVRVKREGVKIVHRRGVEERSAEQIAGDSATAALLAAAPPENPFGALLQVGEPSKGKSGKAKLVPVTVRVPLRALTLLPEGAAHRAQLAFHFSLRDPDGGYRRLEPRPLEFSVPNEKLAASLGQAVTFQVELQLEPGDYRLGVAVVDRIGGATSATTAQFAVAKTR